MLYGEIDINLNFVRHGWGKRKYHYSASRGRKRNIIVGLTIVRNAYTLFSRCFGEKNVYIHGFGILYIHTLLYECSYIVATLWFVEINRRPLFLCVTCVGISFSYFQKTCAASFQLTYNLESKCGISLGWYFRCGIHTKGQQDYPEYACRISRKKYIQRTSKYIQHLYHFPCSAWKCVLCPLFLGWTVISARKARTKKEGMKRGLQG